MDLTRMPDGTWEIIHVDTAANVLDLYNKIQANLTQLQQDAGVSPTPPVTPPPVTPPATTGFRGIFAFNNMAKTSLFVDNPNVAGTALTYYWSQLEPQGGQFNWSLIDNDMQPWIKAGKSVILRISTAGWAKWQPEQNSKQGTPQWVFDQGVQHVTETDGAIKPQYWNPHFLASLADFIHAFAGRYDDNPNITCIEIGVGDGGETKVDTMKNPNMLKLWQAIGYSDQVWFNTIQQIVTMYAANFTKTPLALMPDASFLGGSLKEQDVINYIAKLNNRNIWIQDNGLIAGQGLPSSFSVLPKGWPILAEQRNDTGTSGDKLDADLSTAINNGAVAILVFTSDLQNAANQSTLAKYAAMVGK